MAGAAELLWLNVGGEVVSFAASTLANARAEGSMLQTLFSDRWANGVTDPIPVDRDGAQIRTILRWLETGGLWDLLELPSRKALLEEAKFYLLDRLVVDLCTAATYVDWQMTTAAVLHRTDVDGVLRLQGKVALSAAPTPLPPLLSRRVDSVCSSPRAPHFGIRWFCWEVQSLSYLPYFESPSVFS